jgi:hypothetical protein
VRTATRATLPSGGAIQLIAPPAFIGTKLEAFDGRGRGDFLSIHDIEDMVIVVDGRAELLDEVASATAELRAYLAMRINRFLQNPDFVAALPGHLPGDAASQARLPIILDRLRQIAALEVD